jgi:hypothetical protein
VRSAEKSFGERSLRRELPSTGSGHQALRNRSVFTRAGSYRRRGRHGLYETGRPADEDRRGQRSRWKAYSARSASAGSGRRCHSGRNKPRPSGAPGYNQTPGDVEGLRASPARNGRTRHPGKTVEQRRKGSAARVGMGSIIAISGTILGSPCRDQPHRLGSGRPPDEPAAERNRPSSTSRPPGSRSSTR